MSDCGVRMHVAGFLAAYDLDARNTVTEETRTVTVYANDGQAAYARGFRMLDAESGDRSWCFDSYRRRD